MGRKQHHSIFGCNHTLLCRMGHLQAGQHERPGKGVSCKTDGTKEVHKWQKIWRRLTGSKENNWPGVQIEAVEQSHPILQEPSLISSLVHKTCLAWHHHFTVHHPAAETGGIKMGFFTPLLCHNHPWLPYPPFPVLTMTMTGVYPVTGHR